MPNTNFSARYLQQKLIHKNLELLCIWGLFLLLLGLTACTDSKPNFRAVDITGANYAQSFALPDAQGKPRSLADFAGKVVVVFFGYTQCPDVCPTTMSELAEVKRTLGPLGDKVQGVFISLDPERDTREVLSAYMANFDPSFVALRADTPEALAAAAKEFKIFYKKVPGKTPSSYTLDHTAASYVFDVQGHVRLYTRYGSGAAALAEDLKLLLNGA
jgi:protein SCO1/2